jgi:hypothetical protein
VKNGGKRECTNACPRRGDRISVLCVRRILQVDFFRTWKVEPHQYRKKNRCSISQNNFKKDGCGRDSSSSSSSSFYGDVVAFYCNLFSIGFTERQSASDNKMHISLLVCSPSTSRTPIRSRIYMLLLIMLILSFILFCCCSSADICILANKIQRELRFHKTYRLTILLYHLSCSTRNSARAFIYPFTVRLYCKNS